MRPEQSDFVTDHATPAGSGHGLHKPFLIFFNLNTLYQQDDIFAPEGRLCSA